MCARVIVQLHSVPTSGLPLWGVRRGKVQHIEWQLHHPPEGATRLAKSSRGSTRTKDLHGDLWHVRWVILWSSVFTLARDGVWHCCTLQISCHQSFVSDLLTVFFLSQNCWPSFMHKPNQHGLQWVVWPRKHLKKHGLVGVLSPVNRQLMWCVYRYAHLFIFCLSWPRKEPARTAVCLVVLSDQTMGSSEYGTEYPMAVSWSYT